MQGTLSLDGADPCQLVVLSENPVAHESAMEICSGVMARFEAELAFTFNYWKLKDLSDPVSAHWAEEAVARADILLFSLQSPELTPETLNWLESCIQLRTKSEGALALMVTKLPGTIPVFESLLYRMQYLANRLRMDFLPLIPLLAGMGIEALTGLSSAARTRAGEEPGGNHWGLNE